MASSAAWPCSATTDHWRSFEEIFAPGRNAARSRGKGFFVGECGTIEQTDCGHTGLSKTAKAKWFSDAVTIFILPPSFQALERRLRGRGAESERSTEQRLATAAEELPLYKEYDFTVINDDLDRTVESLKSIVRAARCRTPQVEPDADGILGTFPGR